MLHSGENAQPLLFFEQTGHKGCSPTNEEQKKTKERLWEADCVLGFM